jgi:hypothetical protein
LLDGNIPDTKLSMRIAELFVEITRKNRSEYNHMYEEFGAKAAPKVSLHLYGEGVLFPLNSLRKMS